MSDDQPQRAGKKYAALYLARRKFRERLIRTSLWAVLIGGTLTVVTAYHPDDPLAQIFDGIGHRLSISSLFFFCLILVPLTGRTNPRLIDFIQNKVSLFIMGIGWLIMNSVTFATFGWWEPPTWWEKLALFCLLLGFILVSVDVDNKSNDGFV